MTRSNNYTCQKIFSKLILVLLALNGIGFFACRSNGKAKNATANSRGTYEYNGHKVAPRPKRPKIPYKIVYTLNNVRSDKKPYYLILINPIDLSSNDFKMDVAGVFDDIRVKNGEEISIEIFDDEQALELFSRSNYLGINYELDLDNSKDYKLVAIHTIAQYTGVAFKNMRGESEGSQISVDFFPVANKNVKEVARYIDHLDL
jgi:hypothetical protein